MSVGIYKKRWCLDEDEDGNGNDGNDENKDAEWERWEEWEEEYITHLYHPDTACRILKRGNPKHPRREYPALDI
jgi:hypothetical protein